MFYPCKTFFRHTQLDTLYKTGSGLGICIAISAPNANVKCMSHFWPPGGHLQATGTRDLHHY